MALYNELRKWSSLGEALDTENMGRKLESSSNCNSYMVPDRGMAVLSRLPLLVFWICAKVLPFPFVERGKEKGPFIRDSLHSGA